MVHYGCCRDKVPGNNVLQPVERFDLNLAGSNVFCLATIRPEIICLVKTHRTLWVRIQECHLRLQLARGGPVIVAFAQSDVLAATRLKNRKGIGASSQVALRQQQADFLWVALSVAPHDRARAVSGTVFADNEFNFEVCLLHEHALDGLCDKPLVVIGNHSHADFDVNLRRACCVHDDCLS